MITTTILG